MTDWFALLLITIRYRWNCNRESVSFRVFSTTFIIPFYSFYIYIFYCIQGTAVFDFAGTGPEVYGNCNAPRAITFSAIIYCLRCMIGHDVPLNQVEF